MQVTQVFRPQKRPLFSGDAFPLGISGRRTVRSFAAQIVLTQTDVIF
jgi:hypothetical protein